MLVIDEAQDMDASEAALVDALIEHNETLRVIAVGDDDQNIYAFRGADGRFMQDMLAKRDAVRHEMTENYRSTPAVVDFSNAFVSKIKARLKTHALTAVRKSLRRNRVRQTRYVRPTSRRNSSPGRKT